MFCATPLSRVRVASSGRLEPGVPSNHGAINRRDPDPPARGEYRHDYMDADLDEPAWLKSSLEVSRRRCSVGGAK